jgi:Uma2 family endonuclease
MPKRPHSQTQVKLIQGLTAAAQTHGLELDVELHLRVSESRIRIADVCVFRHAPEEDIPTIPPLVVIEVISPDDSHSEIVNRLDDYQIWGVAHIWAVDPTLRQLYVYRDRDFRAVKEFRIDNLEIRLTEKQILPKPDRA